MELVIKQGEYLPHWTLKNSIYHVCFRLFDSLPVDILRKWELEKLDIIEAAKAKNKPLTINQENQLRFLQSKKIDKYLDKGIGKCYLVNKEVADMMSSVLMYFNDTRYKLYTWCIMPNHIHVIIMPLIDLFKVVHSWKSYSANLANKILVRRGKFWHEDAYNHIIRNSKEFGHQMNYVWQNPEKAGYTSWKYRYKIGSEF